MSDKHWGQGSKSALAADVPGAKVARPRFVFGARPLAYLCAAAWAGILIADHVRASSWLWLLGAGVLAGVLLLLLRARTVPAVAVLLTAGGFASITATLGPGPRDVSRLVGRPVTARGVVISHPRPSGDDWRFVLRCHWARSPGSPPHAGNLLVRSPVRPALGDRVEVSGTPRPLREASNPGGFSAAHYWRRHDVFARLRARAVQLRVTGRRMGGWNDWTAGVRERIVAANERTLPPRAAFFANALLVGEDAPPEGLDTQPVEEAFRRSGTIHLLVVSGTQVSWVLFVVLALGRVRLSLRRAIVLPALVVAAWYAAVAGGSAPVLRAAVMGGLLAVAYARRRDSDLENSLGLAALAQLLLHPLAVYDVGLQFSLAAVWGVGRLGPWLRDVFLATLARLGLPPGGAGAWAAGQVLGLLGASLGAVLAVAPLVSHYTQLRAPVAVLANLPTVPLTALLMAAAALHAPFALAGQPLGWLERGLVVLSEWLWACVRWFAALPGSHGWVYPPPWIVVAGVYGLLLLAVLAIARRQHRRAAFWTTAAALSLWAAEITPASAPVAATVTFLDVGQGDCTLLQLPEGHTLLVDAGGTRDGRFDVGARVVTPALRALRVPRLDMVVATHPHEDHIGGLRAVVEQQRVGTFLDSGTVTASPMQYRLLQTIRDRSVRFVQAEAGQQFRLGAATVEVLGPPVPPVRGTRSDLNNNSVVLRVRVGGTTLLLPGDAEAEQERWLLDRGVDLRADVLKVGHHGSRWSTSDRWLAAVRPRIAVVSCGENNPFGHPAAETLTRLQAARTTVYRTDTLGAITLSCLPDGQWRARTKLASRSAP